MRIKGGFGADVDFRRGVRNEVQVVQWRVKV